MQSYKRCADAESKQTLRELLSKILVSENLSAYYEVNEFEESPGSSKRLYIRERSQLTKASLGVQNDIRKKLREITLPLLSTRLIQFQAQADGQAVGAAGAIQHHGYRVGSGYWISMFSPGLAKIWDHIDESIRQHWFALSPSVQNHVVECVQNDLSGKLALLVDSVAQAGQTMVSPIGMSVARIPVKLPGADHVYDLHELLKLKPKRHGGRENPTSRQPFELNQIIAPVGIIDELVRRIEGVSVDKKAPVVDQAPAPELSRGDVAPTGGGPVAVGSPVYGARSPAPLFHQVRFINGVLDEGGAVKIIQNCINSLAAISRIERSDLNMSALKPLIDCQEELHRVFEIEKPSASHKVINVFRNLAGEILLDFNSLLQQIVNKPGLNCYLNNSHAVQLVNQVAQAVARVENIVNGNQVPAPRPTAAPTSLSIDKTVVPGWSRPR